MSGGGLIDRGWRYYNFCSNLITDVVSIFHVNGGLVVGSLADRGIFGPVSRTTVDETEKSKSPKRPRTIGNAKHCFKMWGLDMKRSALVTTAIGAAFAAALSAASPAMALEAKECAPREQIIQALQTEGQFEVISGQRTALGMPKDIFTTNRELNLGYNLEAGVGPEVGKICVAAKYTNIRFNNDPNLSRPAWASLGPNTGNDQYLSRMEERDDTKVLMGANALVKSPDGTEHAGALILVTRGRALPTTNYRNAGEASVTSANGGITTLFVMANIDTNDNFTKLANRRVETASVDRTAFVPH